jgi:signal peptidase I
VKADVEDRVTEHRKRPAVSPSGNERIWREVVSWFWVILAFLLIEGTLVQARVIPSGSMENTVLVGDHLIVSRFGYDAGIPFTRWHVPLWRNPNRQQIIVFRAPLPEEGNPDFIKRCIGTPGDRIKIVAGQVFVNDVPLKEPYALGHRRNGRHYYGMGAGLLEACDERRDRGSTKRLFYDGRQPR